MKRWIRFLAALLFHDGKIHDSPFVAGHEVYLRPFFRHFGWEAECPEVNLRVLTALIGSAGLAGMLINTIPRKHTKRTTKKTTPDFKKEGQ